MEDDAAYNEYMRNQIAELLGGNYGPHGKISELWIDGIWLKHTSRWEFEEFYHLVKTLQPDCQVGLNHTIGTGQGKPIHPADTKDHDPIYNFPSDFRADDGYETGDGEDHKLFDYENQTYYLPFEATLKIGGTWFNIPGYNQESTMAPSAIAQKYNKYRSENNVLVLNCPPNKEGRMEQKDIDALYAAARILGIAEGDARYATADEILQDGVGDNLALGATGDSVQQYIKDPGYEVNKMFDGNTGTRWASRGGDLVSIAEFELKEASDFNLIRIQEDPLYPRTESFKLEMQNENGEWITIFDNAHFDSSRFFELSLDESLHGQKFRLSCTDSSLKGPTISEFELYNQANSLELTVSEAVNGELSLKAGESFQLEPALAGTLLKRNSELTFASSNEDVISVDENGLLQAKADGEAEITISLNSAKVKTSMTLTIKVGDDVIEEAANTTLLNMAVTEADRLVSAGELEGLNELAARYFNDALAAAKEVQSDAEATQEEVNTAWSNLVKAIHMLNFKTDFSVLDQLLARAEAVDLDSIPAGAEKEEFTAALDYAKSVRESDTALTDQSIQAAIDRLQAAMDNLPEVQLDLSVLSWLVSEVEDTDLSLYLEAGQDEFTSALEEARAILNAPEDQNQIDASVSRLSSAWLNLRKKPDEALVKDLQSFVARVSTFNLRSLSAENRLFVENLSADINTAIENNTLDQQKAEEFKEKVEEANKLLDAAEGKVTDIDDKKEPEALAQKVDETKKPAASTDKKTEASTKNSVKTSTALGWKSAAAGMGVAVLGLFTSRRRKH